MSEFAFADVRLWNSTNHDDGIRLTERFHTLGVADTDGRMTAQGTRAWFAYLDQLDHAREDARARQAGYPNVASLLNAVAADPTPRMFRTYMQVCG